MSSLRDLVAGSDMCTPSDSAGPSNALGGLVNTLLGGAGKTQEQLREVCFPSHQNSRRTSTSPATVNSNLIFCAALPAHVLPTTYKPVTTAMPITSHPAKAYACLTSLPAHAHRQGKGVSCKPPLHLPGTGLPVAHQNDPPQHPCSIPSYLTPTFLSFLSEPTSFSLHLTYLLLRFPSPHPPSTAPRYGSRRCGS